MTFAGTPLETVDSRGQNSLIEVSDGFISVTSIDFTSVDADDFGFDFDLLDLIDFDGELFADGDTFSFDLGVGDPE